MSTQQPNLETINRLYLELSQVATAKTANDLKLDRLVERVRRVTSSCVHGDSEVANIIKTILREEVGE